MRIITLPNSLIQITMQASDYDTWNESTCLIAAYDQIQTGNIPIPIPIILDTIKAINDDLDRRYPKLNDNNSSRSRWNYRRGHTYR